MQLTQLLTLLVILVLITVGLLMYRGWRAWAKVPHDSTKSRWRSWLTVFALVLVSLSAILFVAYAVHNVIIGGDRNESAMTVLCIKTGNSLAFVGAIASLGGEGKDRWAVLISGCFLLFLWFGQGMSL
jgi:hypothetical protein